MLTKRNPLVVGVDGCQILTIEIATPFGKLMDQEAVDCWVLEHLPSSVARMGDRLRWHVLSFRNSPEGTRHRLLLVFSPLGMTQAGYRSVDFLFPSEFQILGEAEKHASEHGGCFVWTADYHGQYHWLVYRDGVLAFWGNETLPQDIPLRNADLAKFLENDPTLAGVSAWEWLSAPTRSAHDGLGEIVRWEWSHSFDLRTDPEFRAFESRGALRSILKYSLLSFVVVSIILGGLWLQKGRAQENLNSEIASTGALRFQQQLEARLMDSLQVELLRLDAIGAGAQPRLNLVAWMDALYSCLPEKSSVEQIHLDAISPAGFKWGIQANVAGWDAADAFMLALKKLPSVRSVRMDNRRVSGDRIVLRLEVIQ